MINLISKILKNIFTGADNETYHMAKFSWAGSMVVVCAIALHSAWLGHAIDLMSMAGALVAICTGHSAAIYGMKSTEPPPEVK
jgi:hypothetical protein